MRLEPLTICTVDVWWTVGSFTMTLEGMVVDYAYTHAGEDWYKVLIEYDGQTLERTVNRSCITV